MRGFEGCVVRLLPLRRSPFEPHELCMRRTEVHTHVGGGLSDWVGVFESLTVLFTVSVAPKLCSLAADVTLAVVSVWWKSVEFSL